VTRTIEDDQVPVGVGEWREGGGGGGADTKERKRKSGLHYSLVYSVSARKGARECVCVCVRVRACACVCLMGTLSHAHAPTCVHIHTHTHTWQSLCVHVGHILMRTCTQHACTFVWYT